MEAKFRCYEVRNAGFYRTRSSVKLFGELEEILHETVTWASSKRYIGNTKTYQVDADSSVLNTFYCDSESDSTTGDICLVLWAEVESDSGVIYGLNEHNTPGVTDIEQAGFSGANTIPGFPSYFWISPRNNLFVSVVFEHSKSGKVNFEKYIEGFLENYSRYIVKNEDGEIIGFSQNGQFQAGADLIFPQLYMTPKKNRDVIDDILRDHMQIRRFIKREKITTSIPDDRNFIERVFSQLLGDAPIYDAEKIITHNDVPPIKRTV